MGTSRLSEGCSVATMTCVKGMRRVGEHRGIEAWIATVVQILSSRIRERRSTLRGYRSAIEAHLLPTFGPRPQSLRRSRDILGTWFENPVKPLQQKAKKPALPGLLEWAVED